MPLDDRGNPQIDFVYGNIPMQPNYATDAMAEFRRGEGYYPGNGESEYYVDGHATVSDWGDPTYFPADYLKPSQYLDGHDSHVIDLRQWNNFPQHDPNTGFQSTVNWWLDGVPATQFPNLMGKKLEDAIKSLREVGVAENFLQDTLTDATNPYDSGTWLPTSGAVIWKYLAPDTVIGTHWDGRDWLASEAEGLVVDANQYPGNVVPIGSYWYDGTNYYNSSDPTQEGLAFPYWLSFAVLQTKDPLKNSWNWWN